MKNLFIILSYLLTASAGVIQNDHSKFVVNGKMNGGNKVQKPLPATNLESFVIPVEFNVKEESTGNKNKQNNNKNEVFEMQKKNGEKENSKNKKEGESIGSKESSKEEVTQNTKPKPSSVPYFKLNEEREDVKENPKEKDVKEENFNPKQFEKSTPILEICRKSQHNIESKEYLDNLQSQCDTIMGTINITGFDGPSINLGNIEHIQGDLIIQNCPDTVSIEAHKLVNIDGMFALQSLTSLVTLEIPVLVRVKKIEWKVVPILNFVNINHNIKDIISIVISDTSLSSIEGFNNIQEIEVFNINNNRFLETLDSNIKKVKNQLSVHANAKELELRMPLLEEAENITIRDTSFVSFPRLRKVDSSLEFIENMFTSLEIPTLETVGGTLGIIDNSNLNVVDFMNITSIQGGLMVSNNSLLTTLESFQSLKQIGGAIHFEGSFEKMEFPELKLVKGSAFIKSNSNMLDCNTWTAPIGGRSIIRGGQIKCVSGKKQRTQNFNEDGDLVGSTETILLSGMKNSLDSSPKVSHGINSAITNNSTKATLSFFCILLQIGFSLFGLYM